MPKQITLSLFFCLFFLGTAFARSIDKKEAEVATIGNRQTFTMQSTSWTCIVPTATITNERTQIMFGNNSNVVSPMRVVVTTGTTMPSDTTIGVVRRPIDPPWVVPAHGGMNWWIIYEGSGVVRGFSQELQ